MDRPRRSIEQVEVIEHRIIEEGRRPARAGGSSVPYTTIRKSTETFETRDGDFDRYQLTGENDVSREPSFIHDSANYGQHIELSPTRNYLNTSGLNTSGPRVEFADTTNNTTVINNFGYDVHEIHTSDGGARIVETHGSGPLRDHSRLESTRIEEDDRPGVTSALRSGAIGGMRNASSNPIFTVQSPISNRNDSYRISDTESFARKDSYKRMQQSDELMGSLNVSNKSFVPQSQASLVSRSTRPEGSNQGWFARTKAYVVSLIDHFRNIEYTPKLLAHLCCILFFLVLLIILLGIVLNALFHRYAVTEFLLYPPVCEECRRRNPSLTTNSLPSSVFIHFYSSSQAHFELRGNSPFKSNSFTAIDFQTGYVAIADHALTDSNGRHTTCFLMPLDRSAINSIDELSEAVTDSSYEIQSTFGWQEFWQFEAEAIDSLTANSKFTYPVRDCSGAKWYLLKQSVHARDVACSDCYDFCLPDWAVVRKEKYEDESTLGIRRLDCFRLYVPEWRNFRVETDISGGHWQYPLASESTKRDQDGEWVSWVATGKGLPFQQARKRR
ncbi:unnamed protein product [Auanema sp. JU1783]|nr:unnamed protein product [Auanema sp. JU1783]